MSKHRNKHLPIDGSDREYMAELGYVTSQGHWLKIASSDKVNIPSERLETKEDKTVTADVEAVAVAEVAADFQAAREEEDPLQANDAQANDAQANDAQANDAQANDAQANDAQANDAVVLDGGLANSSVEESRIILTPLNPRAAYTYWEVSEAAKAAQRRAGGQRWALRIYDVTDIDVDHQPPHHTQEYACDEQTQDMHVSIPMGDRDYLADLGVVTDDNQWLSLIRSLHVRAPEAG